MCLIAISNDFLDRVLPKPELSGDEDLPDKLLRGEFLSSCLGGINLRMFITLSTIFVPYIPGLTLSVALAYARFNAGTELPLLILRPLGRRPLEGEHDCRRILPLGAGSTEADRTLGAPGLPLVAEIGLSESDVRKFGGASREKPGISEGFHGLGFTVGELARGGAGFLAVVGPTFGTDAERDLTEGADELIALGSAFGLRIGVVALDVGLDASTEALLGGVEDLAFDLVGVEDLAVVDVAAGVDLAVDIAAGVDLAVDIAAGVDLAVDIAVGVEDLAVNLAVGVEDLAGTVGLVVLKVAREVGVEDREGLDAAVDEGLDAIMDEGLWVVVNIGLDIEVNVGLDDEFKVGRPVGVAGLDPGPPDEEGL